MTPIYATNSTDNQRYMRSTNNLKNFAADQLKLTENTTEPLKDSQPQYGSVGLTATDKILCYTVFGVVIIMACLLVWKMCKTNTTGNSIHPQSLYHSGVFNQNNAEIIHEASCVDDLFQINLMREIDDRRDACFNSNNSSKWSDFSIKLQKVPTT